LTLPKFDKILLKLRRSLYKNFAGAKNQNKLYALNLTKNLIMVS